MLDHIYANMIIFVINYHGVSLCDIRVLYESINKCPKGSLCTYNQACWNIISCHPDIMFNFFEGELATQGARPQNFALDKEKMNHIYKINLPIIDYIKCKSGSKPRRLIFKWYKAS